MILARRRLLGFALADPAIVAAPNLMRVSTLTMPRETWALITELSVEQYVRIYLRPKMQSLARRIEANFLAELEADARQ